MRTHDRGNLPAEVSSFVGRTGERAEARRLLGATRILTLTGAGGVGKTRLARQLAAELRRSFRDGVWFVELAELTDGALVPAAIGSVLGRFHARDESAADLTEHLRDRQLLLVVDNCEHLIEPVAALVDALLRAAPHVRVLATSRQVLGVEGERVLPVPPMSVPHGEQSLTALPDAMTLFAERAASALPDFVVDAANRELVARICRRLDGIPLAIELAAARLRAFSLHEVFERLDAAPQRLVSTVRTTPERHRTLAATVAWSHQLCAPVEQTLWARLSVFSDGFTVDAVEEVCSDEVIDRGEVFDLLASLVDRSIVTRDGGADGRSARLEMLGLLREFGAERLREAGDERALRLRHRDHFRDVAARGRTAYFSPREQEWSDRVRREHANLRAAVQFCHAELHDHQAIMEIAAPLQLYRVGSSFVVEEHRWLASALDADPRPTEARARALVACSYAASLMGRGEEAERHAAEGLRLATDLGLDGVAGDAACGVARASFYGGDRARTLRLSIEAAELCRRSGNVAGACDALYRSAVTALGMGDPRAASFARESLDLAVEHGSPYRVASSSWVDGLCHWRDGDQHRATVRLREALPLYDQRGFVEGIAMCCEGLALTAAAMGDDARAAALRGAADAAWRETASPFPQAVVRSLGTEPVGEEVRRRLGEAAYRAAFERGAAFTVAETVAYAVGGEGRHVAPQDALPAAVAPATTAPATVLTRREAEVAALVAQGLSNREIAETLVIAQRTAEGHVERILAKLGFRSRAQIATWVAGGAAPPT